MPIQPPPTIDDRKYPDILAEAVARIRVHNPEWNNFNDSDPGMTLLQLFAFMSESLLYRANLIPERNRLAFLKLLGIPLNPASAASGLLTIHNNKAPIETLTLAADQECSAGKLPFRTQDAVDVLPVEAQVFIKRAAPQDDARLQEYWETLYAGTADSSALTFYQTEPVPEPADPANLPEIDLGAQDTVGQAVWIALLARDSKPETIEQTRTAMAGKVLNLGLYPAPECDPHCDVPAGNYEAGIEDLPLVFEIGTGTTEEDDFGKPRPHYEPLPASIDEDLLKRPGVVKLTLPAKADQFSNWTYADPLVAGTGDYPPLLEDPKLQERVVTWLRVGLASSTTGAQSGMQARFHWTGINCVRINQRARAVNENLRPGTGEPEQRLALIHTPVLADSVHLEVNGEPWKRIDDLYRAPPEVKVHDPRLPLGGSSRSEALSGGRRTSSEDARVFTVDRESGEIRFGDGIHGARPPENATIRASYDYGGGAAGNVNIGAINKAAILPTGYRISNPLPTWGGAEHENVVEGERNIARHLQHRDRLVTTEDFTDIARRTPGVDIGRVELLPLFDPRLAQDGLPGMVTLLVIPKADTHDRGFPAPDQRMLQQICSYLAPRRLISTELHVRGPEYQGVIVSVGIEVAPGYDIPTVREAVNQGVRKHLSPLLGGREGKGWRLSKAVVQRELWAEATRIEGVSYVNQLILADATSLEREELTMRGLELPRLLAIETRQGAAAPLTELTGEQSALGAAGGSDNDENMVPVPVIPREC